MRQFVRVGSSSDYSAWVGKMTAPAAGGGAARMRALALVPNTALALGGTDRFLLVTQAVPTALAGWCR